MNLSDIFNRLPIKSIALASALSTVALAVELPSREEMWAIIQQQQQEIATLKDRVGLTETNVEQAQISIASTDEKIEATSAFVEDLSGGSASSASGAFSNTQIGGYGELHVNFGNSDIIDFHRWVLFLNHDFNENVRLFSEFELEHSLSGDGKPGEVELEQAFIEFDLNETDKLKAGLFLVPVGILNETHEPNTFYGVERNLVEKNVVPSTWWEAGLAYSSESDNGFSYDLAVHSGLKVATSGSKAFNIRSGRQKVAKADASDGAITGRVTYSGIPGLDLGATVQYQQDLAQSGFSESVGATLFETHAQYTNGGFSLKGLYARWDLDGTAAKAIGADEQYGFYVEPGYRFDLENSDIGVFARYSAYDTTAGAADSDNSFIDVGINYWPIDNVVFKADVQFTNFADSSKDEEIVNLGIGYSF